MNLYTGVVFTFIDTKVVSWLIRQPSPLFGASGSSFTRNVVGGVPGSHWRANTARTMPPEVGERPKASLLALTISLLWIGSQM
jgi:hypothetical protein